MPVSPGRDSIEFPRLSPEEWRAIEASAAATGIALHHWGLTRSEIHRGYTHKIYQVHPSVAKDQDPDFTGDYDHRMLDVGSAYACDPQPFVTVQTLDAYYTFRPERLEVGMVNVSNRHLRTPQGRTFYCGCRSCDLMTLNIETTGIRASTGSLQSQKYREAALPFYSTRKVQLQRLTRLRSLSRIKACLLKATTSRA